MLIIKIIDNHHYNNVILICTDIIIGTHLFAKSFNRFQKGKY